MPNAYASIQPKKYLDADGLTYFSRKLNQYPTNDVIVAVIEGVQDALDEKIDLTEIGNSVAGLNLQGKVPENQIPDSVHDILEYNEYSLFPLTGEAGKQYVDKSTNILYRWGGSAYVIVGGTEPDAITNAQIDALFT